VSTLLKGLHRYLFHSAAIGVFVCMAYTPDIAAVTRDIDLASKMTVVTQEESKLGIRLRIINRVPSANYLLRTELRSVAISPLPDLRPSTVQTLQTGRALAQGCLDLGKDIQSLLDTKVETNVEAAVNKVRAGKSSCSDTGTLIIADAAIAQTTFDLEDEIILTEGRELHATVERIEENKVIRNVDQNVQDRRPWSVERSLDACSCSLTGRRVLPSTADGRDVSNCT
jgi:hypothetical protein